MRKQKIEKTAYKEENWFIMGIANVKVPVGVIGWWLRDNPTTWEAYLHPTSA